VPYSAVGDLLTGQVPTPTYLDPAKYVSDASDEVDSFIGHIYVTPVDVTEMGPTSRPARLLLKRIANWLASGRLLMAASAGNQKLEINAYANTLVADATRALEAVASGDVPLIGAPLLPSEDETQTTGPQIYNVDAESNVEAFYDRIANPHYHFLFPRNPGGELVA
jgi:phage gp36-like protein